MGKQKIKTLIIFNQMSEGTLHYRIVKGDYSKLNGTYINGDSPEKKQDEANKLIHDDNWGLKSGFSENIKKVENKNWDKVALISFLP